VFLSKMNFYLSYGSYWSIIFLQKNELKYALALILSTSSRVKIFCLGGCSNKIYMAR